MIIGISFIGISSWLYDQATKGLSYCNSFGDIGYLLFEDCNTASVVSSATLIDLFMGSLMILAGIILLIVGIVKCKKPEVIKSNQLKQVINPVFDKLTKSKKSQDNNIYCRYCGNIRPLEGKLCSRCGKASQSEQLVECNSCHSLTGDYLRYCSNCGMNMEHEPHIDQQLTYKTYESSIDTLKIKYPSHWIIIDENLSYEHVLKICTPPDSLSFLMTISIKKPNTEERELTKEN
jgi:RNA polymerase subunit RPABC4/transcription elongation factor Spt4